MEIPPLVFKSVNITVGLIALFASFSQFSHFHDDLVGFVLGFMNLLISILIIYLEFDAPIIFINYCSVYFKFAGRGLSYIVFSFLISFGTLTNLICFACIFIIGLIYCILSSVPNLEEPQYFKVNSLSLTIGDDDDDDIFSFDDELSYESRSHPAV